MRLYMRSGSVDGKQMSFGDTLEAVGTVYEAKRGYKTIVEYHGTFDMPDGVKFGYTVREATAEEIEQATKPVNVEQEKAFWSDFFDNTDTIR